MVISPLRPVIALPDGAFISAFHAVIIWVIHRKGKVIAAFFAGLRACMRRVLPRVTEPVECRLDAETIEMSCMAEKNMEIRAIHTEADYKAAIKRTIRLVRITHRSASRVRLALRSSPRSSNPCIGDSLIKSIRDCSLPVRRSDRVGEITGATGWP